MEQITQPQQPAGPVTPQSNDEAIGDFARGFLQEIESNDDPDDPDSVARQQKQQEQPESPEAEAPAQEAETPALPEGPMVEVDIDGEKFTIPEKVKHRVMADKDYRQKTMEVAATRKQLEALTASAQQLTEQAQQMAPYHAQLFQMDNHAQYLEQQLRSGQLNDDPIQFNRVQGELAILLRNRDAFAQGLQQQSSRLNAEQQQLLIKQLELDAPKLLEEFPEIAKPETRQKLREYVTDAGLPQEAIAFLNFSAAGTRLAYKAHQYDVMVADQAKAKAKLQEKVKTLPSATQSSRAADVSAKDKHLREQWKKGGGRLNDPNFDQILAATLRKK